MLNLWHSIVIHWYNRGKCDGEGNCLPFCKTQNKNWTPCLCTNENDACFVCCKKNNTCEVYTNGSTGRIPMSNGRLCYEGVCNEVYHSILSTKFAIVYHMYTVLASWMLQVEACSMFHQIAWQCLRWVQQRFSTCYRNNVTLQGEEKCCPYYLALNNNWLIFLFLEKVREKRPRHYHSPPRFFGHPQRSQ